MRDEWRADDRDGRQRDDDRHCGAEDRGRSIVVVAFVGVDEERHERRGEDAAEDQLEDDVGRVVGDVVVPHWFYFTPLRKHGLQWSKVVIWSSGIGTFAALLGIVVGVWMYSPRKRYRYDGAPTGIPYRGQKRWHMVLGLIFGVATATWAFSGMLSMEPFPLSSGGEPDDPRAEIVGQIQQSLRSRMNFEAFAAKDPRDALAQLATFQVKELEWTTVAGEAVYMATLAGGDTRIVPVDGQPVRELDHDALIDFVRKVAGPDGLVEARVLDQYDAYYLDRRRERPLPVILARINDAEQTRFVHRPENRAAGRRIPRQRLGYAVGLSRPPLARLPLALQLPARVGHRGDCLHARRHGTLRDLTRPGLARAGPEARAHLASSQ